MTLADRSSAAGCIDKKLHKIMCEQENYWKNILSRGVATIIFLCQRGLLLRGSNKIISSENNGNYLRIVELIDQFDPYLSQHIHQFANCGRGHSSYF